MNLDPVQQEDYQPTQNPQTIRENIFSWFNLFTIIIVIFALLYRFGKIVIPKEVATSKNHPFHWLRIFIIAAGIVYFWKGGYSMVDIYFFPNYPLVANIGAIIIGFFLVVLMGGRTALENYIG
jgi:hypothetical protein